MPSSWLWWPFADPSRSASPVKRRQRSQNSQRSTGSGITERSSIPTELLPLLQDKLPELEAKFPDIAKSVKEFVQPQPAAPAAALHGAQSACQIAFRDLQTAESQVSEFESEASELVAELRSKIAQLNEAQLNLASVRKRYDDAAKVAQTEVKKHTNTSDEDQIATMVSSLEPEKLQEIAERLAEAATQARAKLQQQAEAQQQADAERLAAASAAQAAAAAAAEAAQNASISAQGLAASTEGTAPAASLEQSVAPLPSAADATVQPLLQPLLQDVQMEGQNVQPVVTLPLGNEAAVQPVHSKRVGSRSPRRSKASGSEHSDCDPEPDAATGAKAIKTREAQSAGGRSHSRGSGRSQLSHTSQPADATPAHYSAIASQLEDELKKAAAPRP